MTARKRVGILISGRGSNMEALIRAAAERDYPAEVVLVVSNRADAAGLAKAEATGVPTAVIEAGNDRAALEAGIEARLLAADVEIVCLAGYMRLLSEGFVQRWRDRVLNIHPSLLPAFPGLDTHARALAAGVRIHGCTVHFVRPAVDAGPIIAQAAVAVAPDDTPETLAARVLAAEHRLYPSALLLVAAGRTRVSDERVTISGLPESASLGMLVSPGAL